ncbi:hypothetical protein IFM89_035580, partial [Coptis chinensis]
MDSLIACAHALIHRNLDVEHRYSTLSLSISGLSRDDTWSKEVAHIIADKISLNNQVVVLLADD